MIIWMFNYSFAPILKLEMNLKNFINIGGGRECPQNLCVATALSLLMNYEEFINKFQAD